MKDKPDIQALQNFIAAGDRESIAPEPDEVELEETTTQGITVTLTPPRQRVQKIFRLRWDIVAALKVASMKESEKLDRRVSEAEIVERVLKKHFGIK